jgi:hypothetical protein
VHGFFLDRTTSILTSHNVGYLSIPSIVWLERYFPIIQISCLSVYWYGYVHYLVECLLFLRPSLEKNISTFCRFTNFLFSTFLKVARAAGDRTRDLLFFSLISHFSSEPYDFVLFGCRKENLDEGFFECNGTCKQWIFA